MSGAEDGPTPGYRPCVAVLLVNRDGRVFVGRRKGAGESGWQVPQGGIDPGEDPLDAARRELHEEIGTDKAEPIGACARWLDYDLPAWVEKTGWRERYRGQSQKWFAFRFTGRDDDIDVARHDPPEFDAWRWAELDELPALIVDFKRPVYEAAVAALRETVEDAR